MEMENIYHWLYCNFLPPQRWLSTATTTTTPATATTSRQLHWGAFKSAL